MTCLNNCLDDNMSQTPDVWADDVFLPKKEECLTLWVFQRLWVSNDLHQESGAQPPDWHPARRDFISPHPQCHKEQQKRFLPLRIEGGAPHHKSTLNCEITISLNKQMAVQISGGFDFIHRCTSKTPDGRLNQAVRVRVNRHHPVRMIRIIPVNSDFSER